MRRIADTKMWIYITNTLIKQGNGIDSKFEKLSNIWGYVSIIYQNMALVICLLAFLR